MRVIEGADLVIHLAAKVGGIGFNQKYPGELFYDNISMGTNIIECARVHRVKKVLVVGTICAYPASVPIPFRESDLWDGYPEATNAPYGSAKKALWVMLESYRRQYGLSGIFLLPVNLYGPRDNFDLEASHVIPALIRKFVDAKESGATHVSLWGDGSPTREFLYVTDAARGIVLAALHFDGSDPVNLGSSEEISIRDLAELIREKVGFSGSILWDRSRPNGQERRKVDIQRAQDFFGFRSQISLAAGLQTTINWWLEQTRGART
jgi:GDP-L-fucose synthase